MILTLAPELATQAGMVGTHLMSTLTSGLSSSWVSLAGNGGIPNPGSGEAPPGSQGLLTILKWAAWIAFSLCVLGVIACGAMMAVSAFSGHGRGGEHVTRIGWVLGGCILIGSASGVVGALV